MTTPLTTLLAQVKEWDSIQNDTEGEPLMDLASKIHSSIYKQSDDPLAPSNRSNEDFLRGYDAGQKGNGKTLELIQLEWKRIGSPPVAPQSFKDWKRGLWAGTFRETLNGI
jgi:hypothetical protein